MKHQLQTIRAELTALHGIVGDLSEALTALSELERMAGEQEPVAWINPKTGTVISEKEKTMWHSRCGGMNSQGTNDDNMKAYAAAHTEPCFATPPAQQPQAETEMRPADKHDMAVYRAIAEGYHADKQPQAGQYQGDDSIAIPRSLIAAACGAIRLKHDAPKLLAELRRYTVGDWSRALTQQPQAEAVPPNVTRAGLFSLGQGDTKMCFHAGHTDPETLVLTLTENVTGGPYRAFWAYVGTEVAADAALAAAPKGGM